MSKVNEALAEIDAAILAMAPAHEGLRDYAMLNIAAETRVQVLAGITIYDRRLGLLLAAKERLELLLADGYPTLEIPPVEDEVMLDLKANSATIDAALGRFWAKPPEAVTLTIVPGDPTNTISG